MVRLRQRGKWIVQRIVEGSTVSRTGETKKRCTQVLNAKNAKTWGTGLYLSIAMGQGPFETTVTRIWICLT